MNKTIQEVANQLYIELSSNEDVFVVGPDVTQSEILVMCKSTAQNIPEEYNGFTVTRKHLK